MLITAYPLTWPLSNQRTPNHKRASASYRAGFAKARDDLLDELRLFGADNVVISSDIPLRKDGLPYASFKEPVDPGIAVYFRIKKQSYALTCDAWDKAKDNLRAIGEYIAAVRTIRSCRVAPIASFLTKFMVEDYVLKQPEQAKKGDARRRSPPKASQRQQTKAKTQSQQRQQTKSQARSHSSQRTTGRSHQQSQTRQQSWREVLGVPHDVDFATVRSAYYAAAKVYHPDSGIRPNSEKMTAVNLAFEKAKLEYGK